MQFHMRSHHTIVSFENQQLCINHRWDQIILELGPMKLFHIGACAIYVMPKRKRFTYKYLVQLKAKLRVWFYVYIQLFPCSHILPSNRLIAPLALHGYVYPLCAKKSNTESSCRPCKFLTQENKILYCQNTLSKFLFTLYSHIPKILKVLSGGGRTKAIYISIASQINLAKGQ